MAVAVHEANLHDSKGAPKVIEKLEYKFQVLPKLWIVERTFFWLENFRRLTIDYEYLESKITLSRPPFFNNYFEIRE